MAVEGDQQSGRDGAESCNGVDGEAGFDRKYCRVEISLYFFDLDSGLSYYFGNSEEEFFEQV